jgi:DNA-binding response OmpR family regulator
MSADVPDLLSTAPILVVDDDSHMREAIRLTLEDEGFEVETASDGKQALRRARARPPALVVLDLQLPAVDGAAVAVQLEAVLGDLPPILLITADDRGEVKARRIGAYACLRKPFNLDDLLALIRHGLE